MRTYKRKNPYAMYRYSHKQKPYVSKCIFCHKDPNLKGYYKCEITGQIRGYKCNSEDCKHGQANAPTTFVNWLNKLLK